uniref:Chromosome 2 open reading frame 72 n=1 Tax=Pan troglodytes TaxID=9598 RepID=A0A2I3RZE1_PANTR
MERELEALAARLARPAEPPFQALVEAAGGRGQVLLVGELWEREQSRALLRDFARAVFPPEPGAEAGLARGRWAARGAQRAARAAGAAGAAAAAARAIRSPLVFVLCRASSLAAREPRRRLREMLRDVRGRRRAGAALVGVLVAEAGPEDAVAPGLRLLEALLRAVFGRQAGGPVQAAAYCPGLPASCLAVQAAACRALQAAGAGQPVEGALERPGLPGLLACFSWGPWSRRKNQDVAACRSSAQEDFQEPEEELALTAIFPNGDCDDLGRGSKACDGVVHTPAEPTGDSR